MGKTERILDNLPPTFRPFPRPSALYTLANAVGLPLQEGENLIVEVMKAHWVDYADLGRDIIRDLAYLADLYDLDPRPDESVEAFREHLKRYVQTFLQGTATVKGILRVAADTLGLTVDVDALRQPAQRFIPDASDATALLFGVPWAEAQGQAAEPARVAGRADLSSGVDLRGHVLRLESAGDEATIVFDDVLATPSTAGLGQIVQAINDAFTEDVAAHDGTHVILTARTAGADSSLWLLRPEAPDAADPVLGIAPRVYEGADERTATVVGTDLGASVDLSAARYLRLVVDGEHLAEVDCAGDVPSDTAPETIPDRINEALGVAVAAHEDGVLTLSSPTAGAAGSIEILTAAANDATEVLFGPGAYGFYSGANALPAGFTSRRPLNQDVALPAEGGKLVLKVDDAPAVEVDCVGETPAATSIEEIAACLAEIEGLVVDHDGVLLTLSTATTGAESRLEVLTADEGEAADAILGFATRTYRGNTPTAARIEGKVELRPTLDLRLRHRIMLAVDNQPAVVIDVAGDEPQQRTPAQIATAIDEQLGQTVATVEEDKLVLTSPTVGSESRLSLIRGAQPASTEFITQAPLLEEAALPLLGFIEKAVEEEAAQAPTLEGEVDLSGGVDLRQRRYLRLGVDDQPPVDIDCQGSRPRITLLSEILDKINAALPGEVAGSSDGHLVLSSPTAGPAGRIVVERSTAGDAAEQLLGVQEAIVIGTPPQPVAYTGTTDLSLGVDVKDQYLLQIGVDDLAPVTIDLRLDEAGEIPDLPEIVLDLFALVDRINAQLGRMAAFHNGINLILRSSEAGANSRLVFEAPADAAHDATAVVLGFTPPRTYVGEEPVVELRGSVDLSGGVDLRQRRYLRLSVDNQPIQDIDCAGDDAAQTTLTDIVGAINAVFPDVARDEGGRLVLASTSEGAEAILVLQPSTAADATELILGDVAGVYSGEAATPAVLMGDNILFGPIDLSERRLLRLAVDGAPPALVDVAGVTPARTFSDEVVDKLNEAFPRPDGEPLAALTAESKLQLTAVQSLAVLPLRYLTLVEFPPAPAPPVSQTVSHGDRWTTTNEGVTYVTVTITLTTAHGVVGPTFVNYNTNARIHVPGAMGAGQTLEISLGNHGQAQAWLDGEPVAVTVDPPGAALRLPPGTSTWQYTDCYASRFDYDVFDAGRFAGGQCRVLGIFDLSRFVVAADDPEVAVFAPAEVPFDTGTTVTFTWEARSPGRFELELPYDLPRLFGGRFDEARFDGPAEEQEADATGLMIELEDLPGSIIAWVAANEPLLSASGTAIPPPGATIHTVPWERPRLFEGGADETPARLVLTEAGLDGFVVLEATAPGEWGNHLELLVAAGETPGTYDVTLGYAGQDTFESARAKVAEQVIRARAAGVETTVTRLMRDPE